MAVVDPVIHHIVAVPVAPQDSLASRARIPKTGLPVVLAEPELMTPEAVGRWHLETKDGTHLFGPLRPGHVVHKLDGTL
jgi:hypothetical protein